MNIQICLNNISAIYSSVGDKEKAYKFCKLSLEMKQRLFKGDNQDIALSLNNLGLICKDLDRKTEAIDYCKLSLEMRKRLNDSKSIAVSLAIMLMFYFYN